MTLIEALIASLLASKSGAAEIGAEIEAVPPHTVYTDSAGGGGGSVECEGAHIWHPRCVLIQYIASSV